MNFLDNISHISFANKEFFWLFLLMPFLVLWYIYNNRKIIPAMIFPGYSRLNEIPLTTKERLRHLPFILRLISFAFIIIALARPQSSKSWQSVTTEGIDIIIAQDVSPSMLARDLKPNRMEAAKKVAVNFIDSRPDDRMGLVIFSGESFTQCPLTSDHTVLKNVFKDIQVGLLSEGTAIGLGLANAVARIKESNAKSKVIILLTDGMNNAGNISPELASELAVPFGIRVYTIGVGTNGMALSPVSVYPNGEYVYDYVKCDIDEEVLKKISAKTGGRYFRATNNKSLETIYEEIDKLEKTIVEEKHYSKKSEWFMPFLLIAFVFIIIEFFVRQFYLRLIV